MSIACEGLLSLLQIFTFYIILECSNVAIHTTPHRMFNLLLSFYVQLYFSVDQKRSTSTCVMMRHVFMLDQCDLRLRSISYPPSLLDLFLYNTMFITCEGHAVPSQASWTTKIHFPAHGAVSFFYFELKHRMSLPFSWAKFQKHCFKNIVSKTLFQKHSIILKQIPPTPR